MVDKDSKQDLFLISGWAADNRSWVRIADFLSKIFRLHYIDLADPCYAIDTLCENIDDKNIKTYQENLIDKIGESLPASCHLLGWSLGGMLATQISAKFSDKVLSLITLASNISFVECETWPVAMSSSTFNDFSSGFLSNPKKTISRFVGLQSMGDERRKDIISALKKNNIYFETEADSVEQHRASALLNLLSAINNVDRLYKVVIPSLMVFADGDALVPISSARELKKIKGPNLDIKIIEKSSHAIQLSQPDELTAVLSEFYKKMDVGISGVQIHSLADCSAYRKDKKKIARSFSAAAKSYDSVAQLQREVADQLLKFQFDYSGTIADLGCGTGYCARKVLDKTSDADIICLDLAEGMLQFARQKNSHSRVRWLGGDIESLPFADTSIDGIVSSLSVQWSDDLHSVFSEAKRVLKPGGWMLCSSLGPSTLHELNASWLEADPDGVHVNHFLTALHLVDAAEQSDFILNEFSVEPKVLSYATVLDLMKDLKSLGAHNVNQGYSNDKNRGLTGKKVFRKLFASYENFRRPDNTLPATYEVIYLLLTKSH